MQIIKSYVGLNAFLFNPTTSITVGWAFSPTKQEKENTMHADKKKVTRLLKTAQGQIDGLIKMVEEDRYCVDISTQLLATQAILRRVNFDILKGHFEHCIKDSLSQADEVEKDKKISELVTVLDKILRQ